MTSRIFIWLLKQPNALYAWGIEKNGVFEICPEASLADIASVAIAPAAQSDAATEVVVLLSGDMVFSTVVSVPEQQAKYLQQALPYLVEEQLAEDIADMHIVLGKAIGKNQYVVAGISRSQLTQQLARLAEVGLPVHVMVADSSCCPAATVLVVRDKTLLQLNPYHTYSISHAMTMELVAQALTVQPPATNITWLAQEAVYEQSLLWLERIRSQADQLAPWVTQTLQGEPLSILVEQYRAAPHFYQALNFLQGAYSVRRPRKALAWRGWRPVILTCAVVLGLQLLFDIGQSIYLNTKTHQLEKQTKEFYQALFPHETITDNVKAQLLGKLKNTQTSATGVDFLDTYSRIVTVMQAQSFISAVKIEQVSFNDEKGEVQLQLLVANFEQLSQLKAALAKEGLQVEIGAATNEASKTKVSIKVWQ